MSRHERIRNPYETAAAEKAMRLHLQAAVDVADTHPGGHRAIGEALCAALDTVGAGAPTYGLMGDLREDARVWAELATPLELEAYAAHALRRMQSATFASRARKRLFWALWEGMSEADRDGFLARVRKEDAPP